VTTHHGSEGETERLVEIVADLERAVAALPEAERRAYERAEDSIVDARRSAEQREGLQRIY
jgi:hypothetical protein